MRAFGEVNFLKFQFLAKKFKLIIKPSINRLYYSFRSNKQIEYNV